MQSGDLPDVALVEGEELEAETPELSQLRTAIMGQMQAAYLSPLECIVAALQAAAAGAACLPGDLNYRLVWCVRNFEIAFDQYRAAVAAQESPDVH